MSKWALSSDLTSLTLIGKLFILWNHCNTQSGSIPYTCTRNTRISQHIINRNTPPKVSHQCDHSSDNLCMVKSVMHACTVRNYSVKFRSKIFLWVQLTHENITQQINFMTKLSQMNISQTTVYPCVHCWKVITNVLLWIANWKQLIN